MQPTGIGISDLPGIARYWRLARRSIATIFSPVTDWLARASPRQRQVIAITGSILLHLCLLLLLLPAKLGLSATMGTITGLGEVNGAGTAITLVDVSELVPPIASQPEARLVPAEEASASPATAESDEALGEPLKPAETSNASSEAKTAQSSRAVQSTSHALSASTSPATAGAFGHDGQSNLDLWNAIAPCWNRIADDSTLPATLRISFNAAGGLAAPPEIERDPNAPITDQNLRSEAQALQALAECGAYPMAKGQRNVQVQFPAPPLK